MSSFSDYKSYEPDSDPYVALEAMRFNYTLRKVLFTASLLLGGFVGFYFKDSVSYYWQNRTGPVSLGDARASYAAGNRDIASEHGRYVTLDNAIPTVYRSYIMERAGEKRPYTEFLCPVFDVVVQTSRGIPSPPPARRVVSIDPTLAGLVRDQRANVHNLNVRFSARGRIYRMDQAPEHFKDLVEFYRPWIRKPLDQAWILVDGDVPETRIPWVYLGIFLVVAFTGVLMFRARSALHRCASGRSGFVA
jgi:hypothetical protein